MNEQTLLPQPQAVQVGDWQIKSHQNLLVQGDEERRLDHKHLCVLQVLAGRAGEVVSRETLLQTVWQGRYVSNDVVAVAISHIRKALGDDARRPRYIKTISGQGYCLIAPVTLEPSSPAEFVRRPSRATLGRVWLSMVVVLTALGLGFAAWQQRSSSVANPEPARTERPITEQPSQSQRRLLAVLPLTVADDDKQLLDLAAVWTTRLSRRLAQVENLDLMASTSATALRQDGRPWLETAADLGVDLVLDGEVDTAASGPALRVNLIELERGEALWSARFTPAMSNVLESAEGAAAQIAAALAAPALAPSAPISAQAQDAYLSGSYWLRSERRQDWHRAAVHFQQAVDSAPDFAEAYLGLVQVRLRLSRDEPPYIEGGTDELNGLLDKVIELDPSLAEAHLARARIFFLFDWRLEEAEQCYRRALKLAPSSAAAHFSYAQFLLAMGRIDGSLQHVARLRELDPLSYSRPVVAWIYNMARDYERALKELDRLRPTPIPPLAKHDSAMKIYDNMGREQEAYDHWRAILELQLSEAEAAAFDGVFEAEGLRGVSRRLLESGEYRNVGHYEPPLAFARYSISVGDHEAAFHWLNQAFNMRQIEILWMHVDPKYDPLRDDARYWDLVRRIGVAVEPLAGSTDL